LEKSIHGRLCQACIDAQVHCNNAKQLWPTFDFNELI